MAKVLLFSVIRYVQLGISIYLVKSCIYNRSKI